MLPESAIFSDNIGPIYTFFCMYAALLFLPLSILVGCIQELLVISPFFVSLSYVYRTTHFLNYRSISII
ncbi:hypothetical protein ACJIZ3_015603 [Penstemon smallii]|uniref:Uncharacterized protein n=1 Tax=Penstemon smallii TaxID=265156 RepID=A0ABD3RUQ0_9LAMI